MLDIRFVRENPDAVKENIKKKFQDDKLPLVDEVIELDAKLRAAIQEADELRSNRKKLSKQVGALMGQAKKDPSKGRRGRGRQGAGRRTGRPPQGAGGHRERAAGEGQEDHDDHPADDRPVGPDRPDDSANVEVARFGDPVVPDYEIPYHTQIMESFGGIDLDSAGPCGRQRLLLPHGRYRPPARGGHRLRARLYDRQGLYLLHPPFMIRGNVVTGVMSFAEMDAMMYKIEGEDLYLIGTSEHSMIGKFIDQILPESSLPQTLTSYSPCFRKEKGAHGIEERGIYRIHQFEKQEMVVICRPEESMDWYEKMWRYSVELFRSMEIPVRQLECCSGDLADLKVKSCDIEAWSPRQKKYFEVCSCSNLGDAQARRLKIRVRGEDGKLYLAHTLNNTVVAPPRMLIAFLENHLQADGTVTIPEVLWPYMGGTKVLVPKNK